MLYEEREAVLEEIVRSFLEGDALEAVEETLVALLEFLGEGFVSIICAGSHIDGHSEGRAKSHCCEEGGQFAIVAVLETSEVAGPSGVELSGERDL